MEGSVLLHPLQILPEEMWSLIFEYLEDLDFLSCCRANNWWYHKFEERRDAILFAEIFPLLYPYLPESGSLNLRLVYKKTKLAFDNFFLHEILPSDWEHEYCFRHQLRVYRQPPQNYQISHGPPPASSFLYKSVRFPEPARYRSFVENFGSQIQKLEFYARTVGPTGLLGFVIDCLSYTPNVKYLYVQGSEGDIYAKLETRQTLWPRAVENFERNMRFPRVSQLESLKLLVQSHVGRCSGEHNAIIRAVRRQLKLLKVAGHGPVELPDMPRLTALETVISTNEEWEQLFRLNSDLKEVELVIIMELGVDQIFRMLEKFEDSLENCRIILWKKGKLLAPEEWDEVQISAAITKNLKKLYLQSWEREMAMNFVKKFDFLTEVGINLKPYWEEKDRLGEENEKVIPLKAFFDEEEQYEDTVYNCQIWKLFPNLKILRLLGVGKHGWREFTASREMYEYLGFKM